eukprot:4229495-Pyramimonas_sp.AAC.1
MSELGLLLQLGPQNYSYCSSYLERCSQFSVLNSGSRAELVITETNSETSGAFAYRMHRGCRFSVLDSSSRAATELIRTESDAE